MKYRALPLDEHVSIAAAIFRICREAIMLERMLPTRQHQKVTDRIIALVLGIGDAMILRAYKEGFDGNDIYSAKNVEAVTDVQERLDRAGHLIAEAIGAMQNSGRPVDERAPRVLAFWIKRLMEDARRGASR